MLLKRGKKNKNLLRKMKKVEEVRKTILLPDIRYS
jgi:hypothetical protein